MRYDSYGKKGSATLLSLYDLNIPWFYIPLVLVSAIVLDYSFAEPRRAHPLVYFGQYANTLEIWLYPNSEGDKLHRRAGMIALALAIAPWVLVWVLLPLTIYMQFVVDSLLLYLAIGHASLRQHALQVFRAIENKQLPLAKQRVARLVSRDTDGMSEAHISNATIESVLENGNDAVMGAIFWYLVAGAPGVVLYRLSNTLDAMWGYKNNHYLYFGWAAARLDDGLNWLPARLCALTYAILGNFRIAFSSWMVQAKLWESRNAGAVMAAGAAALGITIGGAASYHGKVRLREKLGHGRSVVTNDILRAMALVQSALFAWLGLVLLLSIAIAYV
ncbi:MAG: adenosylcobinamide-phosphate synthase CbiB [Thiohalomonadales bacterium]